MIQNLYRIIVDVMVCCILWSINFHRINKVTIILVTERKINHNIPRIASTAVALIMAQRFRFGIL